MRIFQTILSLCLLQTVNGQSFTSFFVGDTADVVTNPLKGTVLMGGAGENDNAIRWFLERADGGDVLVLRTTGDDGYNDYFFTDLGVDVNSVETIVCLNADASNDAYVLRRVAEADAVWFAGGDQWDYISFWRDTPMEDAFNELINVKQIPIGGTSAGCAIQGQAYFSAETGTITTAQALNDPFHSLMDLGYNDFLSNTATENIISDTHYDNPDRRGRHMAFLARLITDYGVPFYGIGVEEYAAVCIDENKMARVFGSYPDYDDFAYFLQANCYEPSGPEVCEDGEKLTWNRDSMALKVIKIGGDDDGTGTVDLNDWKTVAGGDYVWENWWVEDGSFQVTTDATIIDCSTPIQNINYVADALNFTIDYQNQTLLLYNTSGYEKLIIRDISGRVLSTLTDVQKTISLSSFLPGTYLISVLNANGTWQHKAFVK